MDVKGSNSRYEPIRSTPALGAAIRQTDSRPWPTSSAKKLRERRLSNFYHIQTKSDEAEARAAAHLVGEIAERMRRLGDAYGEWGAFDPCAYFDLTEQQSAQMIQVVERFSTVHIAFFVDPLLPTFFEAESYWAQQFFPAYHAANPSLASTLPSKRDVPAGSQSTNTQGDGPPSAFADEYINTILPEMSQRWNRLITVGQQARRILADHIGYLAVNGSQEERGRWRNAWEETSNTRANGSTRSQPSIGADLKAICPDYRNIPTLTLSIEFPLPTFKQQGRKQRLQRQRKRRRPPQG